MNKQEATSLLKELLRECVLSAYSFILVEPKPEDTLSVGYKIKIITSRDNKYRQQLLAITKKYGLSAIEKENQIVVYKPKFTSLIRK